MQLFRNIQFLCLGFFEFTSPGFVRHKRSFQPGALDVDLSGRHYICTGANSGLGFATALALARRGGHVHLICRDAKRGRHAQQIIESECGPENVTLHVCDMSEAGEVYKWGRAYVENGGRIDALINNAGVMVDTFQESSEKIERGFATNVLGGFVLTEAVREELERRKGRVISVSSAGMLTEPLVVDDLEDRAKFKDNNWDGRSAYAKNKRQQVALIEYWAKKYEDRGVFYASMHPGWASTPGLEQSMPLFHERLKKRLRTADEGADTAVWLAISDEALEYPSGTFFFDRRAAPKHFWFGGTRYTEEKQEALVKTIQALLRERCSQVHHF